MQKVEVLVTTQFAGDTVSAFEFDRPTNASSLLGYLILTLHNVGITADVDCEAKVQHTFVAQPEEKDWLDILGIPLEAGFFGSNLVNSVRIDINQLGPKMRLRGRGNNEEMKAAADVVFVRGGA